GRPGHHDQHVDGPWPQPATPAWTRAQPCGRERAWLSSNRLMKGTARMSERRPSGRPDRSADRCVVWMAEDKNGTGGDRRAGGLGDDSADVALRTLVALLVDRAGLKCCRQGSKQITLRHIGKIAIRGRVAMLHGDDV